MFTDTLNFGKLFEIIETSTEKMRTQNTIPEKTQEPLTNERKRNADDIPTDGLDE